jgi:hypothetical protein
LAQVSSFGAWATLPWKAIWPPVMRAAMGKRLGIELADINTSPELLLRLGCLKNRKNSAQIDI